LGGRWAPAAPELVGRWAPAEFLLRLASPQGGHGRRAFLVRLLATLLRGPAAGSADLAGALLLLASRPEGAAA
jgi:hypothetical protein